MKFELLSLVITVVLLLVSSCQMAKGQGFSYRQNAFDSFGFDYDGARITSVAPVPQVGQRDKHGDLIISIVGQPKKSQAAPRTSVRPKLVAPPIVVPRGTQWPTFFQPFIVPSSNYCPPGST